MHNRVPYSQTYTKALFWDAVFSKNPSLQPFYLIQLERHCEGRDLSRGGAATPRRHFHVARLISPESWPYDYSLTPLPRCDQTCKPTKFSVHRDILRLIMKMYSMCCCCCLVTSSSKIIEFIVCNFITLMTLGNLSGLYTTNKTLTNVILILTSGFYFFIYKMKNDTTTHE